MEILGYVVVSSFFPSSFYFLFLLALFALCGYYVRVDSSLSYCKVGSWVQNYCTVL